MKKFPFLCFCLVLWLNCLFAESAITYGFSGGRFGDNLVSYLHAKWISFYYNIPLIYTPFDYSSQLIMDERECKMDQFEPFTNRVYLINFLQPSNNTSSTLYICPYFWELEDVPDPKFYCKIDWNNKKFRDIIREMISPKNTLQLIQPPDDLITIALHVREGGGFDPPNQFNDPSKFPPISFYVDSLLKILELLKGKQIYCHIFTDAREPKEILDKIQQMLPSDARIIFNFRDKDNHHNANVLEDFFSLFNFDILVRPQSNFSIVPSHLHDFAIVCFPTSFSIDHQNRIVICENIKIKINDELFKKCLEKASH